MLIRRGGRDGTGAASGGGTSLGRDAVRAVMSWRTVLTCWFVILAVTCGLITLLKACLSAGTANYLPTMYEQLVCFILLMILVLSLIHI